MKVSLDNLPKMKQDAKRQWHIKLLKENEETAIRIIKKEIPKGHNLKEYLDELRAEIEADKNKSARV